MLGTLAAPASAMAAEDLVVLDGDPAPLLQGSLTYAKVYINTTVRLTNNTVLNVDSLYIGPRAQIQSCWVPDPMNPLEAGDPAGCTNGRSLTIRARGAVQITPPISLQGGNGPVRLGGSLFVSGSAVTIGGAINTAGIGGLPSGAVTLATGGLLRLQSVSAPGASVTLNGARGVSASADIDVRPYDGRTGSGRPRPVGGRRRRRLLGREHLDSLQHPRGRLQRRRRPHRRLRRQRHGARRRRARRQHPDQRRHDGRTVGRQRRRDPHRRARPRHRRLADGERRRRDRQRPRPARPPASR